MKIFSLFWIVFLQFSLGFDAYSQPAFQPYIEEALANNIVLKQKQISVQQAENALRTARSYFLPTINVLGDYTSGKGGRSIDLPIGDLLNPVYGSLNQLTSSDQFPTIENVNQDFFPYNFYDAKVRTTLPLLNTDLLVNKTIHTRQVVSQQLALNSYKRQLVYDVKIALLNYQAALASTKILASALTLVERNVEINESLARNGKGLTANVLRSKSELARVQAESNSAFNSLTNARRYFNFLLNRNLDASLDNDYPLQEAMQTDNLMEGIAEREELSSLRTLKEIQAYQLRLYQLNRLPKINAFFDVGTQASDWQYNSNSRYFLVGIQFNLPVFQGFRNQYSIHHAKLNLQQTELQLSNTTKQLQLAVETSHNNQRTALSNFHAAKEQLAAAQSYFNLIDKGYQQGVNTLIEFLDARNQLTTSALHLNLRELELQTAYVSLEFETASFPLKD